MVYSLHSLITFYTVHLYLLNPMNLKAEKSLDLMLYNMRGGQIIIFNNFSKRKLFLGATFTRGLGYMCGIVQEGRVQRVNQ